jgi:hypothetical protein
MSDLIQSTEKTSSFHIHVDAAVLPHALETHVKNTYGFFDDDFEHRLIIEGRKSPVVARQLTLKVLDRFAREKVKTICKDIQEKANLMGFAGLIQSEYVMEEQVLSSRIKDYCHTPFPFYVHMRRVNQGLGEDFKTHELHVEFSLDLTEPRLITEMARSGMNVTFGICEVTFTASGALNEVKKIEEGLVKYLNQTKGFDRASIILEATVFHSLHQMRPENTPLVVNRVEYLQ